MDTKYVGEGSHAKYVDKGDTSIGAKDVNKAPHES